jgi:hypothetical protein
MYGLAISIPHQLIDETVSLICPEKKRKEKKERKKEAFIGHSYNDKIIRN